MKISITCHGDMVLYSESTTVENVFESFIPDHRATFKNTRYSDGLPVSKYVNDDDEVVITLEYEEGGVGSSICINCFNVQCDIEMDDDSDFDSEHSANMLDRYQIELISTEDEASFFADDECAACSTIEFGTRYPVRYYAQKEIEMSEPNYCVFEASSCIEIIHSNFGIQGWLDLFGLANYVAHVMMTIQF